jgi:hypothetical protein
VDEVLGELHADEAPADDDGGGRLGGLVVEAAGLDALRGRDGGHEDIGVLEVAQGEGALDAGDRGAHRAGAGGEDEGVVGDLLLDAGGEVAQGHAVGGRVDGHGLGPHAHVEPEPGPQRGRRLQEERGARLDDPAHVVGQAAVGEGDVATALHDDDPRGLVETAQPGRGGHAAGDAADDDNGA